MATITASDQGNAGSDDPELVALNERWDDAIQRCEGELREPELRDIRDFRGPQQMIDDIRERLEATAQGKLKNIVHQISPFFAALQKLLFLFAVVMPSKSPSAAIVAGGAYLAVKKCAEFETASKRIIEILEKIKQQLQLFHGYSETLETRESCRYGLVRMFIALIKFWVATLRFVSRELGNLTMADRWPVLDQKFLISLEDIEEAVKFVQQLAEVEINTWNRRVAEASSAMVLRSPDIDLAEAQFPCHELPPVDHGFMGRQKELDEIGAVLSRRDGSPLSFTFISGLGGVGKSSLALAACHRCLTNSEHDAILWVNAENLDVLRESFTNVALRLLLKGASETSDKDRNFMLVKNWLGKTERKWLLVYDNVDDFDLLQKYLPTGKGSVIITTRFLYVSHSFTGHALRIYLEKLTPSESLALFDALRLSRHANADTENERQDTLDLLEMIDGLPLGIKQMASYISFKKMKVAAFRKKYNTMAKYILERKTPATFHTLSTLWSVQFEDIQSSDASNLLALLSLCDAYNVPQELFQIDLPVEGADNSHISFCNASGEAAFEGAMDDLHDKALITVDEENDTVSLHRLTQEAFIYNKFGLQEPRELQGAFDGLVTLLNIRFPSYGRLKALLNDWATCSRYISHVSALIRIYKLFAGTKLGSDSIKAKAPFIQLLKNASWYLQEIGEMQECLSMVHLATEICDDKESLVYAYLCNTIAVVAIDQNHFGEGKIYAQRAIAIRESKLAADDIDIAISHTNYANLLLNEGKFDECLQNHAVSDSIWADSGQENEVYRGVTYLNTGRAYSLNGHKSTAMSYYEKAEIVFSALPNKMFFIILQYAWGVLFMNNDDPTAALNKFQLALDLAKKVIPTKIIVSAINYKIAVLHYRLDISPSIARSHLESAMTLATYHQREDHLARIGRQLSLTIRSDPTATDSDKEEADRHHAAAYSVKERLWREMARYLPDKDRSEDEEFDWLVSAYYR